MKYTNNNFSVFRKERIAGAHILTRFSTDRQNETSTEDQIEICTQWCQRNNINILEVFSDEAVSGMKQTRSGYEDMMTALRSGYGDMVVIYDQSRMFRKMTSWFAFRDELEAIGVTVISATQPLVGKDLREPQNFMYEGATALFNQMWVLQTRQRVIATMRRMAKEGLHTGGKPALGYRVENGELAVHEPEAAVVRRIFKEYADGRTYRQIIASLNADGIKTRNGNAFGTNSLHDLLKNEKYIGVLVYGRAPRRADGTRNSHGKAPGDVIRIEDAVPPIVDRDTWDKVHKKLAGNKRAWSGRPATVREYPLKGKVFCGECGASLTCTTSKYKYHYYACTGKQRRQDCSLMPIKIAELENYVANAVRHVLGDPSNVDKLIAVLRSESQLIQGNSVARLSRLADRLAEIERQLDQAVSAVLSGLNSPALSKRIRQLENEKAGIEIDQQQTQQAVIAAAVPEAALRELFQEIIATDDVAALLHLVSRVEVCHDTIKIWTILDGDDGDPHRRISNIDESSMIQVDEIPGDFCQSGVIETSGSGSPAPKNGIPGSGIPFLHHDGARAVICMPAFCGSAALGFAGNRSAGTASTHPGTPRRYKWAY